MEKIILIIYINVDGLSRARGEQVMSEMVNAFGNTETILHYIIPVLQGETRIECVNPKLVSEEEYMDVRKLMEETQVQLKEFFKKT